MPLVPTAKATCGCCNTQSRQPDLERAPRHGYPDLDLRPASPLREQMEHWIHQCPNCGYCARGLEVAPAEPALIDSPTYWGVLENRRMPIAARRFLAAAMLVRSTDLDQVQANQMGAAWMCDDVGTVQRADGCLRFGDLVNARAMAVECRMLAAATLRELKPFKEMVGMWRAASLVDALRRAGQFGDARAECLELLDQPRLGEAHRLRFELELKLIRARDIARHSSEECATPERRELEGRLQADRDNPIIGPVGRVSTRSECSVERVPPTSATPPAAPAGTQQPDRSPAAQPAFPVRGRLLQ